MKASAWLVSVYPLTHVGKLAFGIDKRHVVDKNLKGFQNLGLDSMKVQSKSKLPYRNYDNDIETNFL